MSGQERTEEGQPFRVIYAPPPDTTHYCDIPQSAYDLHRRGMKPPEMGDRYRVQAVPPAMGGRLPVNRDLVAGTHRSTPLIFKRHSERCRITGCIRRSEYLEPPVGIEPTTCSLRDTRQ